MEVNVTQTLITESNIVEDDDIVPVIAMAIYLGILSCCGGFGNLFVIIAIIISPKLRTPSYAFVANLGLADFVVNFVVIPLTVASMFRPGWPTSDVGCRVMFYLLIIGTGVSLETIFLIALNRYCMIVKTRATFDKFCGVKPVVASLIYVWFTSVFFIVLPEFGFGTFHYDMTLRQCYADFTDTASYWHVNALIFYGFFTSFLLIPILYWLTFRAVLESRRRVQSDISQSIVMSGESSKVISDKEIRMTKLMVLIFSLIMICWTPFCIVHFFKKDYDVPVPLERLAVMLVYSNSSFNPYIYAWLNSNFRNAYKVILSCGQRKHMISLQQSTAG
ncbi:melatonin receptor type 1B-like [Amphiura filiformis]|uniref:melatonin receptor type 1B-like n=1 Tax=Amphiura filiformis TaxID=82378 RepID=UPI003B2283F1